MNATADSVRAQTLLRTWDSQQTAYITDREARFEIVLDALAAVIESDSVVLDLACGPGSLTERILQRFESVRVVGVDYDPLLLELGRHALAGYGDRVTLLDVDLTDPDWTAALPHTEISAAVSSTALHWLSAPVLTGLYQDLGGLLPVGGVFLNADHLRFDDGRRLFSLLSDADDRRSQERGRTEGSLTWNEWFTAATEQGPWAKYADERTRRFANRPPNPDLSPDFHIGALRIGGFGEAGTLWQLYDDYVILAQK
ncbi:MAG: class I SAM-dependent methyltransferase [Rhodococcus sp.]|nr:class I SAM-dependent methyltransferase [Rhodococcus sp. (in: high G+C Gram-positive bacteria)]